MWVAGDTVPLWLAHTTRFNSHVASTYTILFVANVIENKQA